MNTEEVQDRPKPVIAPRARPPGNQVVMGFDKPGLSPKACSDVQPSTGVVEREIIVANESNDITPGLSAWTRDLAPVGDSAMVLVDPLDERVVKIDARGKRVSQWGRRGRGPGEFVRIRSVAIGSNGHVYTGDGVGRITEFSEDGEVLNTATVLEFHTIADLIILPNGNIVIAKVVELPASNAVYVRIVDPKGKIVRDVVRTPEHPKGQRPLMLGMNEVRLTLGPNGRFAVWYPVDNYVQVFDSTGLFTAQIEGCLPEEIIETYRKQFVGRAASESSVILTAGVTFSSSDTLRVVSMFMYPHGKRGLRIRRYDLRGAELAATDYPLPKAVSDMDRIEFSTDSTMIGFGSIRAEQAIVRFRIR